METAAARPEVQVLDIQTGGEDDVGSSPEKKPETTQGGHSALMSEAQLSESVRRLLAALIDMHTLEELGWPGESVDVLLEKVITQCDGTPADRGRWSRVQRLRENCKQLFLRVVEDASVRRMLETHTIDQVVAHILDVSEEDHDTGMLNCKQLFLRVVEDASVRRMLETHTIDQVVAHILDVSEEDHDTGMLMDSLS
ncbi:unnamed protein product [Plutella xylostella]|uniref:(diamondback moth) hypothetical protein n=1 Tax=Plutella xylostella TaxID=51655 RepID=A0A8S4FXA6_PLUXY|nr:unnamed protein product [Plutella xylostella]